jgi:hypothetical protein
VWWEGRQKEQWGKHWGWLLNSGGSCLIRWRLIRIERRERVRVREGSWGFCSQKDLGRGARGAERRLRAEIREGLDIGNLLSLSSADRRRDP